MATTFWLILHIFCIFQNYFFVIQLSALFFFFSQACQLKDAQYLQKFHKQFNSPPVWPEGVISLFVSLFFWVSYNTCPHKKVWEVLFHCDSHSATSPHDIALEQGFGPFPPLLFHLYNWLSWRIGTLAVPLHYLLILYCCWRLTRWQCRTHRFAFLKNWTIKSCVYRFCFPMQILC